MSDVLFTDEYSSYSIGTDSRLSFYSELGIENYTDSLLYVCNSHGIIHEVTSSPDIIFKNQTVIIKYRNAFHDERVFNSQRFEIASTKKGIPFRQCVISKNDLLTKGFIYLEELELCIGFNKKVVYQRHPKLNFNEEKEYRAFIKTHRDAITSAPIKVVANDALGRIDRIYLNICQQVVSVKVSNNPMLPNNCVVYLGSMNGEYFEYELNIDDIINGTNIECVMKRGVMCLAPTPQHVYKWLQLKNTSKEELYTSKDVQKIVDKAIAKYKYDVQSRDSDIKILQEEIDSYKKEIKSLQEIIKSYNNRDIEEEKRKLEKDKQEFERMKWRYEFEKMEKENELNDKLNKEKSQSSDLSFWATVLKTSTIIIPVLVTLGALLKGYNSPAK